MAQAGNLDFRIVGGDPVLDLVNTVAPRVPGGVDGALDCLADSPDDLLAWARRVGLLDQSEAATVAAAWATDPRAAERAWRATRQLREDVYAVLAIRLDLVAGHDGTPPSPPDPAATPRTAADTTEATPATPHAGHAALERLARAWTAAVDRSRLVLDTGSDRAVQVEVAARKPADLIPDRLALAAVHLLRTADLTQLKVCPVTEGGCGWLFLDRSRNRSRRWCAMADCGARAKSRRLTQRRRQSRRPDPHVG